MSADDDDDLRPESRPRVSVPRPTQRDVPIAKFKDVAVGTSPPRALRGPSLLPGQGAPERIVPEEVELAVLREAVTLDGQQIARVTARRASEQSASPPPLPVAVEILRVRSAPPEVEGYNTTPTSPSARSVQSGTLMSVGSVDPRAPTELSLPAPRTLSLSERAAYFGPEAVVDRSPESALPRSPTPPSARVEIASAAERQTLPNSDRVPSSSLRNVPTPPASSARPSQKTDSPAPHAQQFGRAPRSYLPVSPNVRTPVPRAPLASEPPSDGDAPPQFQIHSDLGALPHEFLEDNFDLRSVSTQREPLASRKPLESSDWTSVHEPVSPRRDTPVRERVSWTPSSSSAITIVVDSGRASVAPQRASIPDPEPVTVQRASVPVSWVLGAAAFALLLALLVAWAMHAPAVPEAAHPLDERGPPPAENATGLGTAPRSASPPAGAVVNDAQTLVTPGGPAPGVSQTKSLPNGSGTRTVDPSAAPTNVRSAPLAPARSTDAHSPPAPPAPAAEASAKVRQSIY